MGMKSNTQVVSTILMSSVNARPSPHPLRTMTNVIECIHYLILEIRIFDSQNDLVFALFVSTGTFSVLNSLNDPRTYSIKLFMFTP